MTNLVWSGFLHLKWPNLYNQHFSSVEEFDSFIGQIRNFLWKDLVQQNITKLFVTKK